MRYISTLFIFCLVLLIQCRPIHKVDSDRIFMAIEEAINIHDENFLNQTFAKNDFLESVIDGITYDRDILEEFKVGFIKNFDPGKLMVQSKGQDGHIRFLHTTDENQGLFRLSGPDLFNYLMVELNQSGNIIDLQFFDQAEQFSETIKRLCKLSLEIDQDTNEPYKIDEVMEITRLAEDQRFTEAKQILTDLPEYMQKEKLIRILDLKLCYDIGLDDLRESIQAYESYYPKDMVLPFLIFQYAPPNKLEGLIQNINEIEKEVGLDSYLNLLRGKAYFAYEMDMEAEQSFIMAVEKSPEQHELYWSLFDCLIQTYQYDKVIPYFQMFQDKIGDNAAAYLIYDGYDEFFASQPFIDWLELHPIEEEIEHDHAEHEEML